MDSVFADHRIIILIPMVVLAGRARYGGVGLLAIMLWPALEGVLALLAVQWRSVYSLWRVEKVLLSILLIMLVVLIALTSLGEPSYILAILVPPLFLAGAWIIGGRLGLGGLLVASLLVLALQISRAVGLLGGRFYGVIEWLKIVSDIAGILSVVLALLLARLLICRAMDEKHLVDKNRRIIYLSLSVFLLLGLAATVVRHGVMVRATAHAAEDHKPFGQVAFAVILGVVLTALLVGRSRRVGLVFAILVPVLIVVSYAAGFLFEPQVVTAARAERIEVAVELYHHETGTYPASLADLKPGYFPFILGPLTGRGQVWCYQGGSDYYRLGYIFIQRYYEPTLFRPFVEIRVYSSARLPPDSGWMCDDELLRGEDTLGL
ncbi:hypothetical protein ACFLV7_12775 [Chloroflexota bacterium]